MNPIERLYHFFPKESHPFIPPADGYKSGAKKCRAWTKQHEIAKAKKVKKRRAKKGYK